MCPNNDQFNDVFGAIAHTLTFNSFEVTNVLVSL